METATAGTVAGSEAGDGGVWGGGGADHCPDRLFVLILISINLSTRGSWDPHTIPSKSSFVLRD